MPIRSAVIHPGKSLDVAGVEVKAPLKLTHWGAVNRRVFVPCVSPSSSHVTPPALA